MVAVLRPAVEVPDHVPAHVAAQHPDAASVVARRAARPTTVRVADRGRAGTPARVLLGVATCAAIAVAVGQVPDAPPAHPERPAASAQPAACTPDPVALLGAVPAPCAP